METPCPPQSLFNIQAETTVRRTIQTCILETGPRKSIRKTGHWRNIAMIHHQNFKGIGMNWELFWESPRFLVILIHAPKMQKKKNTSQPMLSFP